MEGTDLHTQAAEAGFSRAGEKAELALLDDTGRAAIAKLIRENGGTYKAAKTAVYRYIYGGHFSVAKTSGRPEDAVVTQEKP